MNVIYVACYTRSGGNFRDEPHVTPAVSRGVKVIGSATQTKKTNNRK